LLVPLAMPEFTSYAVAVKEPGTELHESTRQLGVMLRDLMTKNATAKNFRLFCPDETNSNRLGAVFEVDNRCLVEQRTTSTSHVSPSGRVMEVLSEHNFQGWLEGYLAHRTPRALRDVRSVRPHHRLDGDAARQMARGLRVAPLAEAHRVAQLPADVDVLAERPTTASAIKGRASWTTIVSKKGTVARVYLRRTQTVCSPSPTTACESRNYVNLVIIDKQPQLQWLDIDARAPPLRLGGSVWTWVAPKSRRRADVVLACAAIRRRSKTLRGGLLAAQTRAALPRARRQHRRSASLFSPREHPHGVPTTLRRALHEGHGRLLLVPRLRVGHPPAPARAPQPDALHVRATRRKGRRRRRSTWSSSTRPAATTSAWMRSAARAGSLPRCARAHRELPPISRRHPPRGRAPQDMPESATGRGAK